MKTFFLVLEITCFRPENKPLEFAILAGKSLWMFGLQFVHLIQTGINFSGPRALLEFTQINFSCPPTHTILAPGLTQVWIEPRCSGWKPSMITTTQCSLQQCNDKMSYLNQMYEKKAMAPCVTFACLASTLSTNEELVMQNLCREPHSSVTVRRFRKLNSCYYVIAIPSGWHSCPNSNCNARLWSKKR